MGICGSEKLMAFLFGLEGADGVTSQLFHLRNDRCGRCCWVLKEVRQAAEKTSDVDALTRALHELGITLPSAMPPDLEVVRRRASGLMAAQVECLSVASCLFAGAAGHYFRDEDILPHLQVCRNCQKLIQLLIKHGEAVQEMASFLQGVGQTLLADATRFGEVVRRARELGQLVVLADERQALWEGRD